jgi:tetratricopeptide (TPR) repeat protein
MFDDPVVRWMAVAAAGLVILYLAGIAGALVIGVIGNPTPRTASERALYAAESAVNGGDHSAKAVAAYVSALTNVGQYGKAQGVLDSAPNSLWGTDTGDLELAQATLRYEEKDYAGAVKAADAGMKAIKTKWDAAVKKPGLSAAKTYGLDANYWAALLIKGQSQQAAGDAKAAVKSYDEYLKQNPMESEVLCNRGDAKMQLKDTVGAKADYQAALKYVPDNARALEGLKKIGAR